MRYAFIYETLYDNNVKTVMCESETAYRNALSAANSDPEKYKIIYSVNLDAEDVIRQSVLAFNELLAKCYPCSIRLYISQNSNKAEVGPANRNFLNDWKFSTSRDFKLLLARFLSDLGFDIDYRNDRNIIITKRS